MASVAAKLESTKIGLNNVDLVDASSSNSWSDLMNETNELDDRDGSSFLVAPAGTASEPSKNVVSLDGSQVGRNAHLPSEPSEVHSVVQKVQKFMRSDTVLKGAAAAALAASLYAALQSNEGASVADAIFGHFDGVDRKRFLLWGLRAMGSEFLNYVRFYFVGALRIQMMGAVDNVSEDICWTVFDAFAAHMVGDLIKTPRFYQDSLPNFCFFLARMIAYDKKVEGFKARTASIEGGALHDQVSAVSDLEEDADTTS